uniref:TniR n=1 Tax=Escherichia coli TaxID=562 RepID=A0A2H4UF52_ECOLX|nr:TniR [Escherichia coli]
MVPKSECHIIERICDRGNMFIGYIRMSKADGSQTNDLQRDALIAAGVDAAHFYEDRASGKREERPGLTACLKALRPGDTLVVWKLDRLGRDLRHLIRPVTGRLSTQQRPLASLSSVSLPHWRSLSAN